MADIQYWEETLKDEIEEIQNMLNNVQHNSSNMSSMERSHTLDQVERKLRSAQGTKRSYKMECRLIGDPNERRTYESKLGTQEKRISKLQTQLKELRVETQRGELFVNASTNNEGADGMDSGDALLKDAHRIQDETQGALNRIEETVGITQTVGLETMEELRKQREQIAQIDETAMKIEDDLTRADKLIRTFGRRMATDKLIQCFAFVNVLLLVAVIIYKIVKPDDKGLGSYTPAPENPVRYLRVVSNMKEMENANPLALSSLLLDSVAD
eukprot:CAMPEP_0178964272 /NCGR_PEP_ID=MMETSP0789-20121207/15568_1 /TAXON_ID=3005 /ORGANISM="Rhizosolenia setigera, Strain CCMP 1694" /LENGTH=269 /DNA_ID=CAMNT_0020648995 /DNA_START=51 /DNA_END=860 /DNA_ORIENTATION=+